MTGKFSDFASFVFGKKIPLRANRRLSSACLKGRGRCDILFCFNGQQHSAGNRSADQYAFPNQLLFLAMMEPWVESQ
jgi:hypothetical protein